MVYETNSCTSLKNSVYDRPDNFMHCVLACKVRGPEGLILLVFYRVYPRTSQFFSITYILRVMPVRCKSCKD